MNIFLILFAHEYIVDCNIIMQINKIKPWTRDKMDTNHQKLL